jgi:DNA gyrase subunit B
MPRAREFDTSSVTVLGNDLSNVRKRPAMYVGDTGRYGRYHLLYFVLDPLVEAGTHKLSVLLHRDGTTEISAVGCTYDLASLVSAQRAGKLLASHDLISVVAALTDPFFIGGLADSWGGRQGLEQKEVPLPEPVDGVAVRFRADPSIFEETSLDFDLVTARLKELAALHSGLQVHAQDERDGRQIALRYPDGIVSYVRELAGLGGNEPELINGEVAGVKVEIAYSRLAVVQRFPLILSFANSVATRGGGSHVQGFIDGLVAPHDPDRLMHMVAVVSVIAPRERLAFSGPTKDVLAIPGLREGVRDLVAAAVA